MNENQKDVVHRFISEISSFEKELSMMKKTDVDYDYLKGHMDARIALETRLLAYEIIHDN